MYFAWVSSEIEKRLKTIVLLWLESSCAGSEKRHPARSECKDYGKAINHRGKRDHDVVKDKSIAGTNISFHSLLMGLVY